MTAATLSLDPISPAIRPTRQDADQRYRYQHYIDGAFVDPASNAWLETSDPVTGEDWAWVARGNAADVERAVTAAHRAFSEGAWPALSASARGALMRKLGDLITENAEWLARVEMRGGFGCIAARPRFARADLAEKSARAVVRRAFVALVLVPGALLDPRCHEALPTP